MDELAVKVGMDPVELRLRNYATTDPVSRLPWSSKHLDACYRTGAEKFDWSKRSPEPRSIRDGERLVGDGMATALYPPHRSHAEVKVRLHSESNVTGSIHTPDLGTPMYTFFPTSPSHGLAIPFTTVPPSL